jgi:3-phosphoshikimate 1-carboxyvinyltransferase
MGARIQELPDGVRVAGPCRLSGTSVDGCGDHRIVMALCVAGLGAQGRTRVTGARAVADSYPEFVDDVNRLAGSAGAVS